VSLLSVVRDVCAAVGVAQPTAVFGEISSNRTMAEMLAVANEMAARIGGDTREWSRLKVIANFTGAYSADFVPQVVHTYAVPSDFRRLLLTSNLWRSSQTTSPLRYISDTDEWINRRARNYADSLGEWTNFGGLVHIEPPLSPLIPAANGVAEQPAETATFGYLSNKFIQLASGFPNAFGDTFQGDSDIFILGERLLKLGMIWHWKQLKGSPYAEDLGTYQDALSAVLGPDKPAPILIDRLRPTTGMGFLPSTALVSTSIVGPMGPPGPVGPAGPIGATGAPGTIWTSGNGPPTTPGATGDYYLDDLTGDIYHWT
jgi:hypothetical protein